MRRHLRRYGNNDVNDQNIIFNFHQKFYILLEQIIKRKVLNFKSDKRSHKSSIKKKVSSFFSDLYQNTFVYTFF